MSGRTNASTNRDLEAFIDLANLWDSRAAEIFARSTMFTMSQTDGDGYRGGAADGAPSGPAEPDPQWSHRNSASPPSIAISANSSNGPPCSGGRSPRAADSSRRARPTMRATVLNLASAIRFTS